MYLQNTLQGYALAEFFPRGSTRYVLFAASRGCTTNHVFSFFNVGRKIDFILAAD